MIIIPVITYDFGHYDFTKNYVRKLLLLLSQRRRISCGVAANKHPPSSPTPTPQRTLRPYHTFLPCLPLHLIPPSPAAVQTAA